jgi:hypothetical protein
LRGGLGCGDWGVGRGGVMSVGGGAKCKLVQFGLN